MAGFTWAGDLNGHKNPIIREFYIVSSTAIKKGQPVNFTQGTGITALTEALAEDFDDAILGIAMEDHDGATTGRQSGTKIEVSISPTAIYRYDCTAVVPLTGGSVTTAVNSNLLVATDDYWNGGAVKIVSCAADPTLNGRVVKISDHTGSGGTLTLAETLPAALASSDTVRLCPGPMLDNYLGFDMWYNSTNLTTGTTANMDVDWTANGGAVLRILYSDPDKFCTYVVFEHSAIAS
jgi:hypothetical protein